MLLPYLVTPFRSFIIENGLKSFYTLSHTVGNIHQFVQLFGFFRTNAAATALGAVLGVIAGQSLSQDAPVQQPYMSSGSCSQYTNQGARAACNRGVSERENERQRRLEQEAYRAGRGR